MDNLNTNYKRLTESIVNLLTSLNDQECGLLRSFFVCCNSNEWAESCIIEEFSRIRDTRQSLINALMSLREK